MVPNDLPIPRITGWMAPLAWVTPLFVAGVAAGSGWSWGPDRWLLLATVGALLTGLVSLAGSRRKLSLASLALAFFLLGVLYQLNERSHYLAQRAQLAPCAKWMAEGESCRLEGITVGLPVPSFDEQAVEAAVEVHKIWWRDKVLPVRVPVLLRIYLPDQPGFEWRRGDRLQFLARLSWPRGFLNEGAGNPIIYYWSRNIVALASCKSPGLVTRLSQAAPAPIDALNRRIEGEIDREVPDRLVAQVLKALLLGRSVSTPELRSAYVDAGVYHLLVISGAHLSLIAFFLAACLGWLRLPEWLRSGLLILLLWLYVDFVQYQVSVMRAFVIVAVYLLGRVSCRRADLLNSTALAALGLLAWRPWFLWDAGFQLTFLSVGTLALVAAPLNAQLVRPVTMACRDLFSDRVRLAADPPMRRARSWRFRLERWRFFHLAWLPSRVFARVAVMLSWPVAVLGRLVLATWAVLVVSMPLLSGLHFPIPFAGLLWSTVAALAVVPILGTLLTVPGLLALDGRLAAEAIRVSAVMAGWLNGLILWADSHPYWMLPLRGGQMLAYLIGLAAAIWWLRRRVGPALLLMGALLAAGFLRPGPAPESLRLVMLDVGDGDSLLLSTPEGDHVMVDTGGIPSFDRPRIPPRGEGDLSRRVLIPLLLEKGVHRLDALILSHLDFDHAGSTPGLLDAFPVGRVYCAATEWHRRSELSTVIAGEMHRHQTPLRLLEQGERLRWHSLELEILHPSKQDREESGNNNSLVVLARWAGHRLLLTGDIEEPVESRLLKEGRVPEAQVLKCAHHGSRTSSSEEFVEAVRPAVGLISAGVPWRYYHPSPEVVGRLKRHGVIPLNTWQFGQIEFRFREPGFEIRFPAAARRFP